MILNDIIKVAHCCCSLMPRPTSLLMAPLLLMLMLLLVRLVLLLVLLMLVLMLHALLLLLTMKLTRCKNVSQTANVLPLPLRLLQRKRIQWSHPIWTKLTRLMLASNL